MMQTFLAIYIAAAVLGAVLLVLAGWHGRRGDRREPWLSATQEGPSEEAFSADDPADVRAAVAVALNRVDARLRDQGVRVDVAIRPELRVRLTGQRLADALEQLLLVTLDRSGRHLLLTGIPQGGHVAISVTDDALATDAGALGAATRHLREQLALRGGVLSIQDTQGEGATITVRLAAARPTEASAQGADAQPATAAPPAAADAIAPRIGSLPGIANAV
ncbi:MAG: hypothetical protein JSS43_07820 [Proteobacteria bacterium]|nr:hypothetical protein [Pseudomonadota bacterium]